MKYRLSAVIWLIAAGCVAAGAQSSGVMTLDGRGLKDVEVPEGKVEFLSAKLVDSLIHLPSEDRLPLEIAIHYRVLDPAPVILNSRLGTEYWSLANHTTSRNHHLHTRENIDLHKKGDFVASTESAWVQTHQTAPLDKGLYGITGHRYFLVDQREGSWLDVVHPPPLFADRKTTDGLIFTAADLTEFTLDLAQFESAWTPEGPVRIRIEVGDADGDIYPVVNVPARMTIGEAEIPFETEFDWIHQPTGWLRAYLPEEVPEQIRCEASISCMTPTGRQMKILTAKFQRGDGAVDSVASASAPPEAKFPRTDDGTIRETRAMWVPPTAVDSSEEIDNLLDRADRAGFNALIVDIFYRSHLLAKSDLCEPMDAVREDFDPLRQLCERAHERGIDIHAWYCVSYAGRSFPQTHPDMAAVNEKGEYIPLVHDLHDPDFRDWFVAITGDVAENYDIDGTHLDYIRTKQDCYCDECRATFAEHFGKPLQEATGQEWQQWNRSAVSDIVRRVSALTREADPSMIMSVAVFSSIEGSARQGQDPALWAGEGWVDMVIPMDYAMTTSTAQNTERRFLELLDDSGKLVTGLSIYKGRGAQATPRSPELVREQIRLVRSLGIHGYCLFASSHLDTALEEMLGAEMNDGEAVPFYR